MIIYGWILVIMHVLGLFVIIGSEAEAEPSVRIGGAIGQLLALTYILLTLLN